MTNKSRKAEVMMESMYFLSPSFHDAVIREYHLCLNMLIKDREIGNAAAICCNLVHESTDPVPRYLAYSVTSFQVRWFKHCVRRVLFQLICWECKSNSGWSKKRKEKSR